MMNSVIRMVVLKCKEEHDSTCLFILVIEELVIHIRSTQDIKEIRLGSEEAKFSILGNKIIIRQFDESSQKIQNMQSVLASLVQFSLAYCFRHKTRNS